MNVSRVAAVHYFARLLGEFIEAYPEIMLDVVVDDRLVDIIAERAGA